MANSSLHLGTVASSNYGSCGYEPVEEYVQPDFRGSYIKRFSPSSECDSRAFSKDYDRLRSQLSYGNQTIYQRYQQKFDKHDVANAAQQIVMQQQRAEELQDAPDQATLTQLGEQYDQLEEQMDEVNEDLVKRAPKDLEEYLDGHLGARSAVLKPEIQYRFSQNPFVLFYKQVNAYTTKKFGGYFPDNDATDRVKSCVLKVPEEASQPVTIEARVETVFKYFQEAGAWERTPLEHPVTISGKIIIELTPKTGLAKLFSSCGGSSPVSTKATVNFDLTQNAE